MVSKLELKSLSDEVESEQTFYLVLENLATVFLYHKLFIERFLVISKSYIKV